MAKEERKRGVDMAINDKAERVIIEYLQNNTTLDGMEIMKFSRIMRERGVFASKTTKRITRAASPSRKG